MIDLVAPKEKIGYFLRSAIALAIVTQKEVKISNIRTDEEKPGLKASDVMYLTIFKQLSNAQVKNLKKGSTEIIFKPNSLKENGQLINLVFPGLVPLLIPHLMLIFYNTTHKIRLNGPTNRENKITIDYIREVLIPLLNKINIKHRLDITKRGYMQDIGSVILYTKETKKVFPLFLTDPGELDQIFVIVHSYGYKEDINNYMIEGARKRLKQFNLKINNVKNIFIDNKEKYKGYGIDLFAITENTILGGNYTSIKKMASQVGKEAADRIISSLKRGTALDKHASNIIIPFLALSEKKSEILIPKKDQYIEIITELCSTFLNTKFEFIEKEPNVLLKITPNSEN